MELQLFIDRLKEHGKTSRVLLVMQVDNCAITEKDILKAFKKNKNIKHLRHLGNEYFSCNNLSIMFQIILTICYKIE